MIAWGAALLAAPFAMTFGLAAVHAAPVPVEIRRTGDDGLTVRFADALEAGIRGSDAFAIANANGPQHIVFQIPGHLEWRSLGDRTRISFNVEFRRNNHHLLGRSRGSCWDTELDVCVARVLRDARSIRRNALR